MPETKFVCPFCGKEYESKLGLSKHLKVCEAKPDEEPDDKTDDPGIQLFDDSDDEYECPECGHIENREFSKCPKCGEALSW